MYVVVLTIMYITCICVVVCCSFVGHNLVGLEYVFSSSPFVGAERFGLCCRGLGGMLFLLCGWMLAGD